MAKFDGKKLRGLVGNLVFRNGANGTIVQRAPTKVNQSAGSKTTSKVFGQGSVLASAIRRGLRMLAAGYQDGRMVNRLNAPVREVLNKCYDKGTDTYIFEEDSFSRLAGFDFNIKSPLNTSLWISPEAELEGNSMKIMLPELQLLKDLKFPAQTNVCTVTAAVTMISLYTGHQLDFPVQTIDIEKGQGTVPAHDFAFTVSDGCLCVAGISLNYYHLRNGIKTVYNNELFNPAGICCAAITGGDFALPEPVRIGNVTKGVPWEPVKNLKLQPAAA